MRTFQDSFYNVWARHDSTNSTYTTIESQKPAIEKFLDDELGEIEEEPDTFYGDSFISGATTTTNNSFASGAFTMKELENFHESLKDSWN